MSFGKAKSGSSFKAKPRPRVFAAPSGRQDHEYRVVWDEAAKLWIVMRDEETLKLSARQQGEAIDMAVCEAEKDRDRRLDVIVSVQQEDGSFTTVWAP